MPYQILFTDYVNKLGIVVEDGTINQETSLKLPGRNATAYGTVIAENFLHLLENFAASTEPSVPVQGQLWYDSGDDAGELRVYNGTDWVTVNGVNKSLETPTNPREGDLWIDRNNLQLMMFTGEEKGAEWVLIGPQFQGGVVTGSTPKAVVGIDDNTYNILQIDINAMPAMIISTYEFTPKVKIPGFVTLYPGMNMSTRYEPGQKPLKYFGVSEKAESLIVNNQSVPAGNFMRKDEISSTSFYLNVQHDTGINYGLNAALNVGVDGQVGVVKSKVAGAGVDIRVRGDSSDLYAVRATSAESPVTFTQVIRVGINNRNPSTTLDVAGNVRISIPVEDATQGNLVIDSTKDSTLISNGSIVTAGGIGVAKSITIGEKLKVGFLGASYNDGEIETRRVIPDKDASQIIDKANDMSYIGTTDLKYGEIHAQNFYGDLTGTVNGSVSGRAGSANQLAAASTFSFAGDVELEDEVIFLGKGGLVPFVTRLSNGFISSKEPVEEIQRDDELLVNRIRTDIGVKKVTVQKLLSAVPIMPIGSIVPYAGEESPPGWLLCDGRKVLRSDYVELFETIGFLYQGGVASTDGMFTLPDLRGRFPLGMHNMGGIAPYVEVVGESAAEVLGAHGGADEVDILEENLPDHKHTLFHDNMQYYALAQKQYNIADSEVDDYHFYTQTSGSLDGVGMKNTQGIKTTGSLGQPINKMNPFLTLNYIIYAG